MVIKRDTGAPLGYSIMPPPHPQSQAEGPQASSFFSLQRIEAWDLKMREQTSRGWGPGPLAVMGSAPLCACVCVNVLHTQDGPRVHVYVCAHVYSSQHSRACRMTDRGGVKLKPKIIVIDQFI